MEEISGCKFPRPLCQPYQVTVGKLALLVSLRHMRVVLCAVMPGRPEYEDVVQAMNEVTKKLDANNSSSGHSAHVASY